MKQPPEFENIQFIAYCTMILAIAAIIFTAGYLTGEMNASLDKKEKLASAMLTFSQ